MPKQALPVMYPAPHAGLMSLDMTQMEVLRRSGTDKEKKYARKILPLIAKPHFLLVTLLLCNALAMEVS
jgi:metal transporter CNNM